MIYQIDHGLDYARFKGSLTGIVDDKKIVYVPDFIRNGCIVEIKGFEKEETVSLKTRLAQNLGYSVKVLRKNDLQIEFSYVRKTYLTNQFQELYDEYKPTFSKTCPICLKVFYTDSRKRGPCCSRNCGWQVSSLIRTGKLIKSGNNYIRI